MKTIPTLGIVTRSKFRKKDTMLSKRVGTYMKSAPMRTKKNPAETMLTGPSLDLRENNSEPSVNSIHLVPYF